MAELVTPQEASRIMRCSVSKIYAMSSRGLLPKVKIGSKLLFKMGDLEQYIDRCRIPTEREKNLP